MPEGIRLNKYLSDAGVCSRRKADALVENGRVCIDGHSALLGERVFPDSVVLVDGEKVVSEEKKVILIYNKPIGVVCSTVNQGKEKNNIVDLIHYPLRIYPVGRLDKDSEGLILLTNDGNIVNRMMRAGNMHEKEYIVSVDHSISKDFLQNIQKGVKIEEGLTRPCKASKLNDKSFQIILTQGMNRQIRKMCHALGYEVRALKRIRIMNISLGDLAVGCYREITREEWTELGEKICNSRN